MSPLSVLWGAIAGGCVTLAGTQLVIARRLRSGMHLLFVVACFAIAGAIVAELVAYHADSVDAYRVAFKWCVALQVVWVLAMTWFLVDYTQIERRTTAWLMTAVFGTGLVLHCLSPTGLTHGSFDELNRVQLPWGEWISLGSGPPHPFWLIPFLSALVFPAFFIDLLVHLSRTRQDRRLPRVGIAFVLLIIANFQGFFVDRLILPMPYLFAPAMLGILAVMAEDLAAEVVRASTLSQELMSNEARWRSFVDNVELVILGVDGDGRVDFVNPFFGELTRYTPGDWLGRSARELVAMHDVHLFEDWLQGARETNPHLPQTQWSIRCASGETRTITWSAVRHVSGSTTRVLAIGADVSERLAAQDQLKTALTEVTSLRDQLERENIYLREEIRASHGFEEIIGESDELRYVLHKIEQVAETDLPVLIEGETGVGKELVAHAVHQRSLRKDHPFIKVNCATLPADLVESELFGHEKGAFTGAIQARRGRFELADGGTLLLDEIGDLPLSLQPKLLRALQEGEVERVGGEGTRRVDVRIIAATNRVLTEEVKNVRFREDLYYRLSVFPLTVPPLRQRRADIPLLVRHFVTTYAAKRGKTIESIPAAVLDQLVQYAWPGNIRELQNVIERAVLTCNGSTLKLVDHLQDTGGPREISAATSHESLESVEREHIRLVLAQCGGQIAGANGAASVLGVNASTLRSRMKKLGVR